MRPMCNPMCGGSAAQALLEPMSGDVYRNFHAVEHNESCVCSDENQL